MKMMTAEIGGGPSSLILEHQQQLISTSPNKIKKIVEKKEKPPPPPKPPKELKITCSACGGIGHMKTNRNCPLYGKEEELASKTVGEICQVFFLIFSEFFLNFEIFWIFYFLFLYYNSHGICHLGPIVFIKPQRNMPLVLL